MKRSTDYCEVNTFNSLKDILCTQANFTECTSKFNDECKISLLRESSEN